MAENKISYGLKNVYYAKATLAADGSATYDTPVRLPGAVSLSLDAEGGTENFYADDIAYYVSVANNGYSGSLELAEIPEAFATDILGEVVSGNNILVEKMNVEPAHFALLFEFQGDQKATKHAVYNCVATRPGIESSTKEDTITPNTKTLDITATSVYVAALSADVVKAKTAENTASTVYDGWYTAVTLPTAPTT